MSLIKSISGIRGTIGGTPGQNLTPQDIVECTAAFGHWAKQRFTRNTKVVIGRDARISGEMVSSLVVNTLLSLGIDVIDLGLSTTPTVEIAVPEAGAAAGIIITASHNPMQWNALKFVNEKGEFISKQDGQDVLDLIDSGKIQYAAIEDMGHYCKDNTYIDKHIDKILRLDLVNRTAIRNRKFKIVVDCINSTGAISIPPLLKKLGCEFVLINENPTGYFAHNPEPLAENLVDLCQTVVSEKADLGIAVDPDVDRLALVSENGELFGEEYTLVAVADYILGITPGNTVSNLSSTRALRDVTEKHGMEYSAAAVGEVNVVTMMKATNAIIGGEGNGGIILPQLHYGRDALVGIALFLSHLALTGKTTSKLKATYPDYTISKNKIQLTPEIDVDLILEKLEEKYANETLNKIDGLKIEFLKDWVHLRKSNTEPIIRIYSESTNAKAANKLAAMIQKDVDEILGR